MHDPTHKKSPPIWVIKIHYLQFESFCPTVGFLIKLRDDQMKLQEDSNSLEKELIRLSDRG
jgi:hypothetical protein